MRQRNTLRVVLIYFFLAIVSLAGSAAEPSWQFIVTGDSRSKNDVVNTVIMGELAAEAVKKKVDFVLFSGDLVQGHVDQPTMDSQLKKWRDTMQPVYDAGIGVYAVRGNHDVDCPQKDTSWNNVFKDKYSMPDNGPAGEKNVTYSFKHKNAFVVGVDEYVQPGHVTSQLWLDAQFAANTEPHVFVFGHIPAFKAKHENCLDNYPAERDKFWASIKKAGGQTYFCGHDHFYNHARIDDDGDPNNDIHQFIAATAGAPLYDWLGKYDGENSGYTVKGLYHSKEYGYCIVKVDGLNATVTWMERVGAGKYIAKDVWSYTASVPSLKGEEAGKNTGNALKSPTKTVDY